jgi:hypothetical protein
MGGGLGGYGGMAASMPAAPIIGSLKAPTNFDKLIPDLHLPESSPDAFSLVSVKAKRRGRLSSYTKHKSG